MGWSSDSEDRDGETPLTDAAQKKNSAIVRALLANGASGGWTDTMPPCDTDVLSALSEIQ